MAKKIDLTGVRFGRLVVIQQAPTRISPKGYHSTCWECLCDCGRIKTICGSGLSRGTSTSCGCYQKELASNQFYRDLTGQKFGRLTVLEDIGRTHGGHIQWRCICDCGNFTVTNSSKLRNGTTKSCGCYNKERVSETSKIDLTGRMFGRLTVLEDVGRRHGHVLWKCLCACGNTVNVTTGSLQSDGTKSCGCYQREQISKRRYIDLTGQVFGRLTVLEDVGRTKNKKVIWRCQCECGNTIDVMASSLQSGATQSCGCYNKEQTSKRGYKSLVGQVFGRLTVLEDVGRDKHKGVIWRCLCDCGNTVDVTAGNLRKGCTQSCGCYANEQRSGERNWNWKGGITPLTQTIRHCTQYIEWRKLIFQRDNFTCSHCNARGLHLIAHHIKFFSVILEEYNITTLEEALQCEALWNISNGLTLCKKCHEREHTRLRVLTS